MTHQQLPLRLDEPLLDGATENALGRCIEAGLYAEHLLATAAQRDAETLRAVADAGRAAWHRFLEANLRLAMFVAGEEAERTGHPLEDVFQEACVGLAEALVRWDHAHGSRFSTFAFPWIRQRAYARATNRSERLRRLRSGASAVVSLAPHLFEFFELADDPVDPFADTPPWWFPHLSDSERMLLALRHGVGTRCHTQIEIARLFGFSLSQVRRLEDRALQTVRLLLANERSVA